MTGHVVQDCGPHGIPSYTDDAGTVHVATGGRCAGPAVPIPPDAARDARRAAYAARERERATAALDRYMSEKYPRLSMTASQVMDVFGAFWAGYAASEEHHKSHYGVSTVITTGTAPEQCSAPMPHRPHILCQMPIGHDGEHETPLWHWPK